MTQEHSKYDQEVIYGTTYGTYIYIENLQQTRLCGARSGSPQLSHSQPAFKIIMFHLVHDCEKSKIPGL